LLLSILQDEKKLATIRQASTFILEFLISFINFSVAVVTIDQSASFNLHEFFNERFRIATWVSGERVMFTRLAEQHRQFVQDLVMSLQALAVTLENMGYMASCYTCGGEMNSANFMVSLTENHLIRFLVSDYGITWTEMRDDRELMKLEGTEAICQLQELANLVKYQVKPSEQQVAVMV
jgi:hypothetical protein